MAMRILPITNVKVLENLIGNIPLSGPKTLTQKFIRGQQNKSSGNKPRPEGAKSFANRSRPEGAGARKSFGKKSPPRGAGARKTFGPPRTTLKQRGR